MRRLKLLASNLINLIPKRPGPPNAEVERRYELLRQWRNDLAREIGFRPFRIFSNQTLRDIAAARPTDSKGLLQIKGVGPIKLSQYGRAILDTLKPRRDCLPENS